MRSWAAMTIGVVVGAAAAVAGALLWPRPAELHETAERFLDALGAGDIEQVEKALDPAFRKAVPPDALRAFLDEAGIASPSALTLRVYSVRNDTGEAYAEVVPTSGTPFALRLDLAGGPGAWRVAAIRVRPDAVGGVDPRRQLGPPPGPEILALVRRTTGRFAEAVAARDLSLFRSATGRAFRERFSTQQFEQAFGGFIDQNVNLRALERLQPALASPPALDDAGVLTVIGVFPSRPSQVRFRYEYAYRHIDWELVGIELDVGPPDG